MKFFTSKKYLPYLTAILIGAIFGFLINAFINKDNFPAENEIISKPKNRDEALDILKKLNGKNHFLISSVCISKNGSMIWKCTDKAELIMKQMTENQLKIYLSKIDDEKLYAYNVYQIEGEGKNLFTSVKGDVDTIMGLPINKIKEYLRGLK